MKVNNISIKKMLRDEGLDMVGIARAETLILSNPPRSALALMPSAQSVIVMGVAHSLGAVYAPDLKIWTRNKMQTSRILDQAAEKLGRILERKGFLSMPISADKPVEIHKVDPDTGKKLKHTKTISQLSFKHAAISAGLGNIGKSNLLLTEQFGPHQRLCGIVTEAKLTPDKPFIKDLCVKGCNKCETACPVSALDGSTYSVDPCFNYWTYGFDRMPPGKLREWPGFIRMLLKHKKKRDIIIEAGQTYITDVDNCIECMKACPVGTAWKKIRPKI